tara:strand:+ start:768764 stop:770659 length:1896 start_codon:yes stop_codon:yes gene_type:complete
MAFHFMISLDTKFLVSMLVVAIGASTRGQLAHAQLSEFDRSSVATQLRSLSENLSAEDLPDLPIAKQAVSQSHEQLNLYFSRHASPENWAAWLNYIDINPLMELIESDTDDRRDLAALGREALGVGQRLVGLAPGLEREPLRDLRRSLDQLVAALRFHDERSLEIIGQQMNALAERIEQIEGVPTPDDEAAINALISTLHGSGQVPVMVEKLRSVFAKPNIAVWVSEDAVRQIVDRPIDEQSPVNDCILGTRIAGDARLTGMVTADLLPSLGTVRMRVQMSGCVNSINKGYNGPVVLRTSGIGQVYASREITFNESGVQMQPAIADVSLTTNVDEIQHRLRLVRRIAKKRAAEQKPLADVIAKKKLHDRIGEEFTKETDATANVSVPDFMEKVRPVLYRLDLSEPPRFWGSTDDALFVNSVFRRRDQIGSAVHAPPLSTVFEAAVQVHESVVNNAVAPILAGRTLNEAKMNELIEQAGGTIPAKSEVSEDEEEEPPFEIDFSRARPVIFEARQQRVRIGIRGTRFAQGRRELKRPMEITAVYAPATMADGRMVLVREGEVDVDFPGGRRLTVAQAGLKGTIKKKFADVFPPMLLDQPITVPDTVQVDALRGRVYHPNWIAANDGWLSLAVQ